MKWFLERIKEKTTWAALGILLGAFGVPEANTVVAGLGSIAAGAVALAGVVYKEKTAS